MSFDWTLRITDLVMILAVLFSPFLAVYAQSRIDIGRERRGAKLAISKDMMGTRRFTLSPAHVQALNRIESLLELLQNQRCLYTMLVPQNADTATEIQTNLS